MLDSACDVMEGSAMLIHEAKQALVSPGDSESQQRLAQVSGGLQYNNVQSHIGMKLLYSRGQNF